MQAIDTVSSDCRQGYSLQGMIIFLDNGDVAVVITGGQDHLGAVALAVPRPSLAAPQKLSATASVLTMLGHKEDELVKDVGEKVAAATGRNVAVMAGVHYDGLPADDLPLLRELWRELGEKIIARINDRGGQAAD